MEAKGIRTVGMRLKTCNTLIHSYYLRTASQKLCYRACHGLQSTKHVRNNMRTTRTTILERLGHIGSLQTLVTEHRATRCLADSNSVLKSPNYAPSGRYLDCDPIASSASLLCLRRL